MEQVNRLHPEKEETFRISVREIVAPLFRRKRILVSTFLGLLLLTIVGAIVIRAPYKAHMAILVRHDRLNPLVSTEATTQQVVNGTPPVTEDETNSEVQLLQSHDVLTKVVKATGLDKPNLPSWIGQLPPSLANMLNSPQSQADRTERAVRKLAKKLSVETGATKSNVIEVTYKNSDPKMAYAVMQALADFYLEKHVDVQRPYGSAKFFSAQMDRFKSALDASEAKLRDFSQDQGLSAPDVERTDLAQQVANAIGQLHAAQQMAAADAAHIRTNEAQLRSTPARSTTQQISQPADKLLEDLNAELVSAQTKRSQLAMKYDAQYPLVKEADKEIAQIQSAIAAAKSTTYTSATTDQDATYELLRQDLAKTRADEAAQQASIAQLKRSIQSMQGEMVALDQKAIQQHDLQRDAKVNEDNYLLYQSKWEQAQASDALDKTGIANVSIADAPEVPALPAYSLSMFLAAGIAFSLFMSIAAAYVVDYLDPAFHTPADVADVLEIPVVVAIRKRA